MRLLRKGKVKGVYEISDTELEFLFTYQISVFNKVIPSLVPHKGETLGRTSAHWFQMAEDLGVNTHFLRVLDDNPMSSRDGLVEYISDGVIVLRTREKESGDVQLTMQVMKMRRLKHSRAIKPYTIDEDGINVHADVEVF